MSPEINEGEIGLSVEGLSMSYHSAGGRVLFEGLNFTLGKQGRLAILGRNGQGKSTLIKLLGGVLPATSGKICWGMSSSWPIGFGGGFQGSLSGLDNIRFIARLYNRPFPHLLEMVDDFAELGRSLRQPVKYYSSGMRARLAFGISLAIDFDCYLIDELVAVGDARFQQKCNDELFGKRAHHAFMAASHDMNLISNVCRRALILESGQAKIFDDIEEAIDIYTWLRVP
jgi:capsular polysaccharide transport system ATP-binding protein